MKRKVICDAEFDSLTPTRCWVVVCKDIETKEVFTFHEHELNTSFVSFSKDVSLWIGCHFLTFDRVHLRQLVPDLVIDSRRVVDLLAVSRTIWYERPGGHSVEAYAKKYGLHKPEVRVYDDPSLIDVYTHRCTEDVNITYRMWLELKRFIYDPSWTKALRVEHQTDLFCEEMHRNGFPFNKRNAKKYLGQLEHQIELLTNEIVSEIGDVLESEKVYILRRKKNGEPHAASLKLLGRDTGFKDGDEYVQRLYRPFNPGSTKDRIDYLNACGWEPIVKTKTHMEAERELKQAQRKRDEAEIVKQQARLAKLRVSGWKVCEENLETLPEEAPDAARKLAEWLTLDARRADLVEWLDAYNPSTSAIHGTFWHIGAWTHRMAHSKPNSGNIFGITELAKGETVDTISPVKRVKFNWDAKLRGLWEAGDGQILVGTDAEGIQLRILAHCMQDADYAEAVANGDKALGTDVHNVNLRALGLGHIVRDDAKTLKSES